MFMRTMKMEDLNTLEIIDPRPRAPWKESPFERIEILEDQKAALAKAVVPSYNFGKAIFTDASAERVGWVPQW